MSDANPTLVQVDVGITPDTWARIYADAVANYRDGQEPQAAFWNAVQEHITIVPNPMVNGAVKGLEDIDEFLDPDDDEQSASATAGRGENDDSPLPEPFDAMPTIEDPSPLEREIAQMDFPPEAVPNEGPIPDVCHTHTKEVTVTVPEWALEAARWRLGHVDPGDLTRTRVADFLFEYVQVREEFRTPDGENATDVLLDELQAANGAECEDEIPRERVGTSELRVDIDAATYDRLYELYLKAVEAGYAEDFETFAVNHTRNETRVTIDGEPATPPTPREETDA